MTMASRASLEITRHYGELSEKDSDAVVKAVAGLIVGYLKTDRQSGQETSAARPQRRARRKESEA
jgi:hypothetical protein